MNKYHVNPGTGRAGICRATGSGCPFGGEEEHFTSKTEARAAYEKSQELNTHITLEKGGDPLDAIKVRGGVYKASEVKNLNLSEKIKLLVRDSHAKEPSEIPEHFEFGERPKEFHKGQLFYSEKSKKLLEVRVNYEGRPHFINKMSERANILEDDYKLVTNLFNTGSYEDRFITGEEAIAQAKADEKARREQYLREAEEARMRRAAELADKEAQRRRALHFERTPPILYPGLDKRELSSAGLLGGGALNHYDRDSYNGAIETIRDGNYSDAEKEELVFQERQRLLTVVTENAKAGGKGNFADVAERVLIGVKGRFVFGKARKRHLEDTLEFERNVRFEANQKRAKAVRFAQDLVKAPLFTTIG